MNIKGGRRAVVAAVSKVWFEELEGRILLSAVTGPIDTWTPAPIGPLMPVTIIPTINPPAPVPVPLPAPLPNAPDTLYISHNPLYAVAGTPLSIDGQYLTVEVLKADGSVDTSYNGDITVGPGTMEEPAHLTAGTLTLAATHGVATFTDLTFNPTLYASVTISDSNGDRQINQSLFVVLPAGSQPNSTPSQIFTTQFPQLTIIQEPTIDPKTGTFSLTAAYLDPQGNPMTSVGLVELSLYSGPEGALISSGTGNNEVDVGALGQDPGNTALANVDANGYATFTGLAVNIGGTYVLKLGIGLQGEFILSNPFQAPDFSSGASGDQGKFAAARSPVTGVASSSAIAGTESNVVNQLLNPGGTAGGVLSILNSPFGGTGSNPLLS